MYCLITLVVAVCMIANVYSQQSCSDDFTIYEWGIDENSKVVVVNAHNRIRQGILNGQVPGQPSGKNILLINGFDLNLSNQARKVSKQCRMSHVLGTDSRWNWIGQNLYITWSSTNTPGQDWNEAVNYWYNEHQYFIYPNRSTGVTDHYTQVCYNTRCTIKPKLNIIDLRIRLIHLPNGQVVWHDSNTLGCDFIKFYDRSQPSFPYAKLYTCNYGPGGNYIGERPYDLA